MWKKLAYLAGVVACSMAILPPAAAQSHPEQAVAAAVEQLRAAMVDADKAALERLAASELSYGHSSGKVEDKPAFIAALVNGTSDFVSITLSDQTVKVVGDVAIVRHTLSAQTQDSGKPGSVALKVLLVWHKQGGRWQLLARQAVRFTP